MSKFHVVSLAYCILAWHLLAGRRWRWYKYGLYILFAWMFLMLTALDADAYGRHWVWMPLEVAFTFYLYYRMNGGTFRAQPPAN